MMCHPIDHKDFCARLRDEPEGTTEPFRRFSLIFADSCSFFSLETKHLVRCFLMVPPCGFLFLRLYDDGALKCEHGCAFVW